MEKVLTDEPSCPKAFAKLSDCSFGSMIDSGLAMIVVEKCEARFLPRLSATGRDRYAQERELCSYRYGTSPGSLWKSAEAICGAGVAAAFAADPSLANRPGAKASFDCGRAKTPLEKAICDDSRLGQSDILLSRAYKDLLSVLTDPRLRALAVKDQSRWLRNLSRTCDLSAAPVPAGGLSCLRAAFTHRFHAIDDCLAGECQTGILSIQDDD
ncbi:MAG: hypothetical protein F8N37_20090 [Telmatospirillum sp.]|nr:hypothetical protein [Telmatospirillum sp.]